MREKLMTLPLPELKNLAKANGIPHYYGMKKEELVEALLALSESAENKNTQAAKREPRRNKENRRNKRQAAEPADPCDTPDEDPDISEDDREKDDKEELKSGVIMTGILEILSEGYGFLRGRSYYNGDDDIYVSQSQIKRFGLKNGDEITGHVRLPKDRSTSALTLINSINGRDASQFTRPATFETLTPVFPHDRLRLEYPGAEISVRIMDLLSPIGKGQRGMIVAQPKVGKTTLLKQICRALLKNHPELHIMILLIDERPEEVTDMQDTFQENNVEIIYSTFDEVPLHHRHVSELAIERAKRLVEEKKDVVILLDSITRLTRACNLTCDSSGKTLSGGLDPAALTMPKKFFGAARCMREGGSLTILATALQETGSRLDDMVYEEFKGTGNMELVLSRKLSERRIFPAIDILRSSTRRDDLLLDPDEMKAATVIHKLTSGPNPEKASELFLDAFAETKSNAELIDRARRMSI